MQMQSQGYVVPTPSPTAVLPSACGGSARGMKWVTCRYWITSSRPMNYDQSRYQLRRAILAAGLAEGGLATVAGPHRDGVDVASPGLIRELPRDGLEPVWINRDCVAQGRGDSWSSPAIANDRVFFFSHNSGKKEEYLTCLEADSGAELWHKTLKSRATKVQQSGTPAVDNGRVYLLGAGRTVRCLDARSGDEVWAQQVPGEDNDEPWHGSPLIAGGKVIVFAGRLAALAAKSGELVWQGADTAKEGVHGSPALAKIGEHSFVIAHVGRGETVAVDLQDGQEHWRAKTEATASTPVVHGERMITLANSRKGGVRCYRISHDKAELAWNYQSLADPGASPVIVGDHVFVQGEKRIACLNLKDGKAAWTGELKVKDPRYTSLIAADGQVIYAFDSLLSFAADPEQFSPFYHGYFDRDGRVGEETKGTNSGPHTCTTPAICDGRLYLRLKQGIACYDLRK